MSKKTNRLMNETSPYLLQHAENPVDWYPWGPEALERAKREDKPIFLSIGYSACHWCHVMAHEDFENEEIAELMNENFVNIKVDREERPDLDDIYQKVCQMTTGSGGWPLSVFLTPDQKPFFAGTYFPPDGRYGTPGFASLLRQLSDMYKNNREAIERQTKILMDGLVETTQFTLTPTKLEKILLDEAAINLLQSSDPINGGFGSAPKFPNASNLAFLLRYHDLSKIGRFRDFVLSTLDKMAAGGIHDHIGGGFHRYSTDSRWFAPHFEKMLYDNALIPVVYIEAFQITGNKKYADIASRTLDYVLREMTHPEGGFYSAQDADSEGVEGKYYTWKKSEIMEALGNDGEIFCMHYGVTEGGNFEGHNILHTSVPVETLAKKLSKPQEEIERILSEGRSKLLQIREKRVKPGRDEKILTSWNGLMVTAFAKGYRVTGNDAYLETARKAVEFIERSLADCDTLKRTFKNGQAKLDGYLDDYAFYINGLLDLFEADSKAEYLHRAMAYAEHMAKHFWDQTNGDFFFTSDNHEKLIVRTKSVYDLSIPSGNSIAALVLLRLYHYTQNQDYFSKAEKVLSTNATMAAENPFAFGQLLNAVYMYVRKPVEVTLIANDSKANDAITWINKQYLPEGIFAIVDAAKISQLQDMAFFKGKEAVKEKPFTAYVCKNFTCSLPLHSID
ncbi:MAG: thioredoxin domain-containing protein, partial [Nitrososphaerales archaeon]